MKTTDTHIHTYQAGDVSSVPGLGRSPGKGSGNPLQCLVWEIPWTVKPGGLQVQGDRKRVGHNLATKQKQQHIQ